MKLYYLKAPYQSPWSMSKKKKVAFCQRQIERLERWIDKDDCVEWLRALVEWIKVKNAVEEGRI